MEKLFTRKEAAELLGISITTLDAARNNGLIAYVQYVPNGCVFFTSASLQEYAKNFYEIVFVVCDKDRNPEQYVNIISKLDDILGPGKAKEIVIFTCPCTLQVILSHFGDVQLTTQAKKAARDDVQRLTDVANYDAHQDQLKTICSKIHYRSYEKMKQRIAQLSTCPDDIPSTNILSLFGYLESQNPQWIDGINERLSAED